MIWSGQPAVGSRQNDADDTACCPLPAAGFSYFLHQRIAQPIEDEVTHGESNDGGGARRAHPPLLRERARHEEEFLVGHGEVRERVQVQQRLNVRRPLTYSAEAIVSPA